MSVVYGVVDWTGAAIRSDDVAALERASVPRFAPDDGGTPRRAADSDAGVAWCLAAALRDDLPEDGHAHVPWVDAEGAFVAAGRLDDRDGVARALGVAPAERATLADVDLLRLAYRAWGVDGLARAPGDWALAAWHRRDRRLVLARDPYGLTALHYAAAAGRVAFASSLRALLAVPWVDRTLDEERLAEFLVAARLPGDAQTLFRGARRVLPAHVVTIDAQGAGERRYWRLEGDIPPPPRRSDDEHVAAVREAFDLAVRCRLRGTRPAATTLSGGLDSTTVTALAARAIGPAARLHAFTWATSHATWRREDEFDDEPALADAVGRHAGNVDVHHVTDDADPVAAIDALLDCHVVPAVSPATAGWLDATLRQARGGGAGALLVGVSGNVVASWGGLGPMRWTVEWRRGGLAAVLRRAVRPLVPTAVARRRSRPGIADRIGMSTIAEPFAARTRAAERVRAADPTIDRPPLDARGMRLQSLGPCSGHESVNLWTYAHEHGLRMHAPTIDLRLVRLTLSMPDAAFSGHGRTRRWLARELARDLLPPVVLARAERGVQAADIVARLRAHAPVLESAFAAAAGSPLVREYLDVPRMRQAWLSLRHDDDVRSARRTSLVFLRGLAFARFLLRLEGRSSH